MMSESDAELRRMKQLFPPMVHDIDAAPMEPLADMEVEDPPHPDHKDDEDDL